MDRLVSLHAFVRTVELGALAKAARDLRLSPVMVGKHIASLEEQFGARLLHRTTRRITLTDPGKRAYESAVRIVREYHHMNRAIETYQSVPTGHLRITMPVAFAERIGPVLSEFSAAYPGITMDILCDDRTLDMGEHKLDLAIRAGKLPDSSLIARRLSPAPVVVCASPSYIAAHGESLTLGEVADHDCIAYEHQWTSQGWAFSDPNGTGEIVVPLGTVKHRSNNAQVQRALVLAGKGLAQMPAFVVEEDIRAGRLVAVLTSVPPIERWIHAVYPAGGHLPLPIRVLVDFLVMKGRTGAF